MSIKKFKIQTVGSVSRGVSYNSLCELTIYKVISAIVIFRYLKNPKLERFREERIETVGTCGFCFKRGIVGWVGDDMANAER